MARRWPAATSQGPDAKKNRPAGHSVAGAVGVSVYRQLEADIALSSIGTTKIPGHSNGPNAADQILASVKRFCHKAQQTLCSEL
jgi:hypothetical protein